MYVGSIQGCVWVLVSSWFRGLFRFGLRSSCGGCMIYVRAGFRVYLGYRKFQSFGFVLFTGLLKVVFDSCWGVSLGLFRVDLGVGSG